MKRREFLHQLRALAILGVLPSSLNALNFLEDAQSEHAMMFMSDEFCADALIDPSALLPREDDVIATPQEFAMIKTLYKRIYRVMRTVGYGNFNTLSFDQMRRYADNYSNIGSFTAQELDFFEELFYEDAQNYGFYGKKVIKDMTNTIYDSHIEKVAHTGHYLFKGEPLKTYLQLQKEMHDSVVLTSGVRNIVKQMYLFLNKIVDSKGNISVASRSLAPAGYSYHGISDFDIGKVGFGYRNFTADFAHTQEFKKLTQLGYLKIRYTKNNPYGVRYEPWHVKVHNL